MGERPFGRRQNASKGAEVQRKRSTRIPEAIRMTLPAVLALIAAVPSGMAIQHQPQSSVDQLTRQGQELAAENHFAEAIGPLQAALADKPGDILLLRTLGKVQARLGNHVEAIRLLREAVALAPSDPDVHLEFALALADAEQFPEALTQVTSAEMQRPSSEQIHLNRARILDDMHQPTEAASEFAEAARLAPRDTQVLYYWALLDREQGRLAQESALLEKLTHLEPDNARAFFFLGRSLVEQSRNSEAILALQTAVRLNPASSGAVYMLARELRLSDPHEADALVQQFQNLQRKDANLDAVKGLGNQAVRASLQGDWPRAIDLLRKAIAQCDGCAVEAGLHKDLGLTLCRDGSVDEGAAELHTSLRLNPNDPDVVRALAMLHR